MISRKPIDSTRIRKITGSFSWLDHRLLADGHLHAMSQEEMLLYFFLVLVGDKTGISFYGYDKICSTLKIDVDSFIQARNSLVEKSLIAVANGRFQVLQLPEKKSHAFISQQRSQDSEPVLLATILKQLVEKKQP